MIYAAKIFLLFVFGAEHFLKTPLWWKQRKAGIKCRQERSRVRRKKPEKDGSQLWQTAFNLETIPERFWYVFQSQAMVVWGVLSALSETNLELLWHSESEGKGFQTRWPKPLLPCLFSTLFFHSNTHITIWNHAVSLCFNTSTIPAFLLHFMTHMFHFWETGSRSL